METNKSQIRKNLEVLIAAVEAYPEKNIYLDKFKTESECGTLYCVIGLAATMPYFIEMGIEFTPGNFVQHNGVHVFCKADSDLDIIFGERSYERLFDMRNYGVIDKQHPDYVAESDRRYAKIKDCVTDKELALWRLRKQLELYQD